jgi:hypothetical protein
MFLFYIEKITFLAKINFDPLFISPKSNSHRRWISLFDVVGLEEFGELLLFVFSKVPSNRFKHRLDDLKSVNKYFAVQVVKFDLIQRNV